MSTCIKCHNAYKRIPKNNKLFKVCRICKYEEEAGVDEYKILGEDYLKTDENLEYYLGSIIKDNTCQIIEKNGKQYTLKVDPGTMDHIYVSHKDKKAYKKI
jgi:hypothetical protein